MAKWMAAITLYTGVLLTLNLIFMEEEEEEEELKCTKSEEFLLVWEIRAVVLTISHILQNDAAVLFYLLTLSPLWSRSGAACSLQLGFVP